ncbi:hypothetical protein ABIE89_007086 [Bradyrhizobium niftali]
MNNGLVPRTQRSVTLAMRSIVQLDGALQSRGPRVGGLRGFLGPGSAQQRKNAAARPGHERSEGCYSTFRHCERSEAIQNLSAEGLWIASLRSQ